MKNKYQQILLALLILVLPILSYATPITADTSPGMLDQIIDGFKSSAGAWEGTFQQIAKRIFFFLAVITVAIELGTMAAKNELEIGGIAVSLGKIMLISGIFWAALGAPEYFLQWLNSFLALADRANAAAGVPNLSVGTMIVEATNLLKYAVSHSSMWDVGEAIMLFFLSLIATYYIAMIAVEYAMTIIKFHFILYMNIIALAFAPFQHTRQWSVNGITNLLKMAFEVMMQKLLIGMIIGAVIKYSQDSINNQDDTSLIYLMLFVIIVYALSKSIHDIVESFFTGFGSRNDNMGQRMIQGGTSAALGSAGQGISNMASGVKSQTQALFNSKTSSSNASSSQSSSGGGTGRGAGENMNTPITSSNNSTSMGSMAKTAIGGTIKATAGVAAAMASEALDLKPSMSASSNQNNEVKRFPTEYTANQNNDNKDN